MAKIININNRRRNESDFFKRYRLELERNTLECELNNLYEMIKEKQRLIKKIDNEINNIELMSSTK